jgi:hypothetical protein
MLQQGRLLFLAPYPGKQYIKDGAAQRIINIDKEFCLEKRAYLALSLRHHWKKRIICHNENLIAYNYNIFLHFFAILKVLRQANIIYTHSIYNFKQIILHLPFIKKQKIWLDVHGVVPEEAGMRKGRFFEWLYNKVEKIAFRRSSGIIYVTEAMKEHYINKYKERNKLSVIYNIYPNFIHSKDITVNNDGKTVILYSGNTQVWQRIDLMVELIKSNINSNYEYIILTGDTQGMSAKLKEHKVPSETIILKSVAPEDLWQYYEKAHYGFILRDDILVNRVANPTKMIEYLSYGIIPIVKLEEIGDFGNYGYDRLLYTDFNSSLMPRKSVKNIVISAKISEMKGDFKKIILSAKQQ